MWLRVMRPFTTCWDDCLSSSKKGENAITSLHDECPSARLSVMVSGAGLEETPNMPRPLYPETFIQSPQDPAAHDHTTKPDFYDSISQRICPGINKRKFFPADVIDEYTSRKFIEEQLKADGKGVFSPLLVDYVLDPKRPAKKVFLILLACGKIDAIGEIFQYGFRDGHLPIEIEIDRHEDTGRFRYVVKTLNGDSASQPHPDTLSSWNRLSIDAFESIQWKFLAPVFTKDKFLYKLDQRCPLPFTQKAGPIQGGFFSSVYEVEVHEAHQKVLSGGNGGRARVALKEIRNEVDKYFYKEAHTLEVIRELTNAHLITPIAAFGLGDSGCFLFPWAEGGNLRELWAKEQTRPLKDPQMMTWVLQQMRGLCHALSALHGHGCRHGDLKPENVLCFHEGEGYKGILRIADVGLAKFHVIATKYRKQQTNTMTGTLRYVPPEFGRHDQIPRVHDVWALGCVFVEFLIWVLYGNSQLTKFNDRFPQFWEQKHGDFVLQSEVDRWLDRIYLDLDDNRPEAETALADLFELITRHMLIPTFCDRSSSEEVHGRLVEICEKAAKDSNYLIDPDISSRISTRPPPASSAMLDVVREEEPVPLSRRRQTTLNNGDNAPARIIVEEVNGGASRVNMVVTTTPRTAQEYNVRSIGPVYIVKELTIDNLGGQQKWMISRYLPVTNYSIQLRNLNDVWESNPDNDFAQLLMAQPNWSPTYPRHITPKLCCRCESFDVWQPVFRVTDRVGEFSKRSTDCDLCKLFHQAAVGLGMRSDAELVCQRTNSTIRVFPDGPTILSLYVDPGARSSVPGFAQLGSPILPEPGSGAQFALLNEWLHVCQQTHDHTNGTSESPVDSINNSAAKISKADLPTRIMDVGSLESPRLCLINGQDMESQDYIALSHRWGKGQMFRTVNENIDDLRQSIDFEQLPRNFQDAITATRQLKMTYLWIDSLCIIQDDDEDWKREASRMQEVFSNATCVIAASSAASSSKGFLRPSRQPRSSVTLKSPSGMITYACRSIDDFHRDVEEAVLNKRGWVLQERALARRTIHFTSTQVYLECGKGVQCESLMKLTNEKAAFLGDSDFPNSILPYYKGGRIVLSQKLYEMYSKLKFSKPKDRSIAISGLEERLTTAFKARGGYGIFESFLERSLLWQRLEGSDLAPIAYPTETKVPSWSWMAYEGSIKYIDAPFEKVDWTKDYESPFDSNSGDHGKRYWETNGNNQHPVIRANVARKLVSTLGKAELMTRITFDRATRVYQAEEIRCIVIGREKTNTSGTRGLHYVLVISPSQSQQGRYVRVGAGSLLEKHISWGSEESVEVC